MTTQLDTATLEAAAAIAHDHARRGEPINEPAAYRKASESIRADILALASQAKESATGSCVRCDEPPHATEPYTCAGGHWTAKESATAPDDVVERALIETRKDLRILRCEVIASSRKDDRWEGFETEVDKWVARIDAALAAHPQAPAPAEPATAEVERVLRNFMFRVLNIEHEPKLSVRFSARVNAREEVLKAALTALTATQGRAAPAAIPDELREFHALRAVARMKLVRATMDRDARDLTDDEWLRLAKAALFDGLTDTSREAKGNDDA